MKQLLTAHNFPILYTYTSPKDIIENFHSQNEDLYNFSGLSSLLTRSIVPTYINEVTQLYEQKYVNKNGISVSISGSYNDVRSVLDILNSYPPQKQIDCNDKKYISLDQTIQSLNKSINVIKNGKHINVKIDNKIYTGSGSLIMIIDKKNPSRPKFMLFKDPKTKQCQDLGGRIDDPNTIIDGSILFNNAKKETIEESMNLIQLENSSEHYVDIQSTLDDTYYRCYLYFIQVDDINQIKSLFDHNKYQVLDNYINNFNESYRELDNIVLFDYYNFIKKLDTYNVHKYGISTGVFQSIDGTSEYVRDRTLQTISKLMFDNVFEKIINNRQIHNLSILSNNNLFNKLIIG